MLSLLLAQVAQEQIDAVGIDLAEVVFLKRLFRKRDFQIGRAAIHQAGPVGILHVVRLQLVGGIGEHFQGVGIAQRRGVCGGRRQSA